MIKCRNIIDIEYSLNDIINKRKNIKKNIRYKLDVSYLENLFYLYDSIFFYDFFKSNYCKYIVFSISSRLRSSAAKTIVKQQLYSNIKNFEIRMGTTFFDNFYYIKRDIKVNGITPSSPEEAVMLVLEHEIIHLLEFIYFNSSSCKNKRFLKLAYNIFKHKSCFHQLPTYSEINSKLLKIRIGQFIQFYYRNEIKNGIVSSINKNIAIMMPSKKGKYIDSSGKKYDKVYISVDKIL